MTSSVSPAVSPTAGQGPLGGGAWGSASLPRERPPLLDITVRGLPAAQGSKRPFRNEFTGRIQMVESSTRIKPWREAVKEAALTVAARTPGGALPLRGPLYVETTFTFPRPKGHYRTGRNAHLLRDAAPRFPAGKPDIEKCVRGCRDALTDAGVWTDDALVVRECNAKVYAGQADALPNPGAHIRIWLMETTP